FGGPGVMSERIANCEVPKGFKARAPPRKNNVHADSFRDDANHTSFLSGSEIGYPRVIRKAGSQRRPFGALLKGHANLWLRDHHFPFRGVRRLALRRRRFSAVWSSPLPLLERRWG